MNLRHVLATPYPQHAFVLDDSSLVYARLSRKRDAFERTEEARLPEGWCSLGPIGLLQVNRDAVAAALEALLGKLDKRPSRASLVIPNGWVRTVAVDVGSVPKQRQEAEDVIRWRLKKLLPCRPEDVRVDYLPAADDGRVLVMLALDRPLSFVEDAFAGAGVKLGRMVPSALALTTLLAPAELPRLLVMAEEGTLTLVGIVDGSIRLLRNKGLPRDEQRLVPLAQRELGQTIEHLRQHGGQDVLEVHLASTSPSATAAVTEWALGRSDVVVRPFPVETQTARAPASLADMRPWLLLAAGRERVR
jgi:Tfp pilus assembly PilM family ATPase